MGDMTCDTCLRLAAVHVSETRKDGSVLVTHFCAACAAVAGYPPQAGPGREELQALLDEAEAIIKKYGRGRND